MDRNRSAMAVKKAIGGGENFWGTADAIVQNNGHTYTYKDIRARVSYQVAYMQMNVELYWDDDAGQVSYHKLNLHLGYNSNFQDFSFDGTLLKWKDDQNHILVRFS